MATVLGEGQRWIQNRGQNTCIPMLPRSHGNSKTIKMECMVTMISDVVKAHGIKNVIWITIFWLHVFCWQSLSRKLSRVSFLWETYPEITMSLNMYIFLPRGWFSRLKEKELEILLWKSGAEYYLLENIQLERKT